MALLALAGPQPAAGESLLEVMALSYRSNPSLLAERARLRATDEGVARALSNWRPTVTLSGNAGKANDRVRSVATDRTGVVSTNRTNTSRTPASATLTISQPIYRGGRTTAELSRAENLVQRGRAQLAGVEQTVLQDTVTAYMNVVRDMAVLELNRNNEQVLTRQLAAARDRFQVGEVTRTDVAQAEARLARAQGDRIQAEGNLTASRANYQRVVGELPGRLERAPVPAGLPVNEQDAARMSVEHPNVLSARFNEAAARNDVDLIAGEKQPTISIQGDLSRTSETQTPGASRDTWDILAVISVPLYQAGSVDARTREAKQTAGQRRMELDDAVRRAREDAIRAHQALNTARARINAFSAQVRAATIALEGVEQEARVGSRTVLDILDAEQELLTAKVNLVTSQRDEVVAAYQLAAATGKLTASSLGLPVDVYDPTENYNYTRTRWYGTSIRDEEELKQRSDIQGRVAPATEIPALDQPVVAPATQRRGATPQPLGRRPPSP